MSRGQANSRALANHELYLARIVLAAWRRDLDRQEIPASTLAQAFQAGTREHLIAAYGWFLLAVSQAPVLPGRPPRGCEQLPDMPQGRVFPGEINEFRQLEASGWLGDLLKTDEIEAPIPRQQDNLAFVAGNLPEHEQIARWLQQLDALFQRMDDSLDEY